MKNTCIICNRDFRDATALRNHRVYMRSKGQLEGHELRTGQSMATPSLFGERLKENGRFSDALKVNNLDPVPSFKQQYQGIFFKPQPRINQSAFSTHIGHNRGFIAPLVTNQIPNGQTINTLVSSLNQQNHSIPGTNLKSLYVPTSKTLEDTPLGFVDDEEQSLVDGEIAHQMVKAQVEDVFDKYNKISAKIPSLTTSNGKTSIGQNSTTTALEDQKRVLQKTNEWNTARDVVHQQLFNQLPTINHDFAISFFIQAAESQEKIQHIDFVPALAAVIEVTDLNKIPKFVLELYHPFFNQYQVQESHNTEDLHQLYKLAQLIQARIEWLKEVDLPQIVVAEDTGPMHERFIQWIEVVRLFMEFRSLYSWDYIKLMKTQLDTISKYRMNSLRTFLSVLSNQRTTFDSKRLPALLEKFLEIKGGNLEKIQEAAERILSEFQLDMNVLLSYIEVALKGSIEVLLQQLREGKEPMTLEQLLHFNALSQKEEQLKQEALEIENKKKAAEEEQKRIAVDQEQQRLRQLKEQKQNKEEKYQQQLGSCFNQYVSMNSFMQYALEDVLAFERDLQRIANTIQKTLKPEQLITLGLLLLSQKHITLIQLATGFGKSMLLGILAQFLNVTTNKKVIVVVPTPFLHLYQESNYCPTASKIPQDINDPKITDIFYCVYEQFLQLNPVALSFAIVLIDEFHELFFNYPLSFENGRLISVIQQLTKSEKVIGVSATFRGDAGIKKIKTIFNDSLFLAAPGDLQEKQLELEVFGKLSQAAINEKSISLAKEKSQQMPVVVFSTDISTCQQWKIHFSAAEIFAGENAGELVALLEQFKKLSTGIILTTSDACKGADFVFAAPQAFVIHTVLPSTWLQLQQDSGRGVRGHQELPVVGAIFTEKPYNSIEQIKKALSFSDRFDRLFTVDYLISHQLLVACSASNATQPAVSFSKAVAMLNEGKSAAEIYKLLYSVKRFKEFLPKEVPKAEFKVPEPITKVRQNVVATNEEEKKGGDTESLLGKRKEPEGGGKTKLGTKDIGSFFASKRQQVAVGIFSSSAASISYTSEPHHILCNDISPNSAQQQPSPHKEEYITSTELQDGTQEPAVCLSSSALEKLNKQAGNDISPSDSVSQVGGESFAAATQRKCESKALSEVSRSSLGRFEAKYKVGDRTNAGVVIREVQESEWEFLEKDKKGNSYYKCLKCTKALKVLKHDRKKHGCKGV